MLKKQNPSFTSIKSQDSKGMETIYKFKKLKDDNKFSLPVEMLILIRKFNMVSKLKFIISPNNIQDNNINNDEAFDINNINTNSSTSSEIILDQNDLQNYIYVLLNVEWLFPRAVELEVDFSSDSLI